MFEPPRCPYPACLAHTDPLPGFYKRSGSYHPRCRPRPVPRFRCHFCGRSFSRQTFRVDYRDHKPHLNAQLVEHLCAGLGLRQSGRMLGLSRKCTLLKSRKLARQARQLDDNLSSTPQALAAQSSTLRLHLDEFESYEGRRRTRPVSIAVAVESETRFIFAARAAPIRPRGKMTAARLRAIEEDELEFGKRPDRSRAATRWAFRRAARSAPEARRVELWTDEKSTYPGLAAQAFEGRELCHQREKSIAPRNTLNPLFAINHTEACLRDWLGRLRRESWLVSKMRCFLNLHLRMYAAFRNWVRPRFNRDEESPGQLLGMIDRRLRPGQLVGWRQDWEGLSPHPLGDGRRVVGGEAKGAARRRARAAASARPWDDDTLATYTVHFDL